MIGNRLSRLFASAAPGARTLGLVDDALTLKTRHHQKHAAWAPHLIATRKLIRDHVAFANPAGPVVVLGAGLGRDLPLNELGAHPAGARLVDAVLLPEMRFELRAWPNITFEVRDVTGLLAHHAKTRRTTAQDCPTLAPLPVTGAGMIVSVNLLSQLVLSVANSPPVDENDRAVGEALYRAHLAALRAAPCPVLLITDTAREETCGERLTRNDTVPHSLIEEYLPGCKVAAWDWTVAPRGELGADVTVTFKVGGWFRP